MSVQLKVCPVVLRRKEGRIEVLAFKHPSAGNQFVKGTIEPGEDPKSAAARELHEESGIIAPPDMALLGQHPIGPKRQTWWFYACWINDAPETWRHMTEDDQGHTFAFFWHPLGQTLDGAWHAIFHEAHDVMIRHFERS